MPGHQCTLEPLADTHKPSEDGCFQSQDHPDLLGPCHAAQLSGGEKGRIAVKPPHPPPPHTHTSTTETISTAQTMHV